MAFRSPAAYPSFGRANSDEEPSGIIPPEELDRLFPTGRRLGMISNDFASEEDPGVSHVS